MLDRLRQVAFLVKDLQEAGELYRRILGMEPCCHQDLTEYGLTNLVLPAGGGTFVELLQPAATDSPAAARYLERRVEAPYLLVFETRDYDRLIPHLK
jgi:catechol 2,3-dioxygenase-like lactoylglutathione lyase family enzyme